jgi:ABC-type multidrug transport system ATPase subunit
LSPHEWECLIFVIYAVDAHTAHHIYYECLKGDLLRGRTVILVSHHVQLCAPGASYVVALDNGKLIFQGNRESFYASGVLNGLVQSGSVATHEEEEEVSVATADEVVDGGRASDSNSETSSTAVTIARSEHKPDKKAPRKLVEEEKRALGRIGKDVWRAYLGACGNYWYWVLFVLVLVLASLSPLGEKGWVT